MLLFQYINNKIDNLNNCQFCEGFKKITIAKDDNSVQFFISNQIQSLFYHYGTSTHNYSINITNGDGQACMLHLNGTTWLNNILYVLTKDTTSIAQDIRVNYIITYYAYNIIQ